LGVIAGTSADAATRYFPTIWQNDGRAEALAIREGIDDQGTANDINNQGVAVGVLYPGQGPSPVAVRWEPDGTMRLLDTLPGQDSLPRP